MTINRSIADLLRSHATIETTAHTAAVPGKNMIINGAMTVNQRGSTTATNNVEHLDRFASTFYDASATTAAATVTKDTDAPTGFGSSMKFDVTTIATGGGDYNYVRQRIEAQNLQHLKYGTADALTCTFSFWFKTTVTGIYSAYFYHMDATYTYVREFTVADSNTWEFFQVTLPGYTSTNFNNDTGAGLEVGITFASTGVQASSNDVWQAGGDSGGSANQVNGLSSTSNNIYTTGWQFEVGSVATDFAHEDIGTTLHKCMRYYERKTNAADNFPIAGSSVLIYSSTNGYVTIPYLVPKRATPTIGALTAGDFYMWTSGAGGLTVTSITLSPGLQHMRGGVVVSGGGFVAGNSSHVAFKGTNKYIEIIAEL